MHRSFTSGIILKMYQNVQSDSVRGGRDTSCVAIAVDWIAVPQINADRHLHAKYGKDSLNL